MKKNFILFIIIIVSFIINAQSQITISPPNFEFLIKPKEEKTFLIKIANPGDSIVHVKTYQNDWTVDDNNKIQFFPANTFGFSSSDWFYINPIEFNLEPHSEQNIRITQRVPDSVLGEYRTMIFFETTPFSPTPNSMIQFNSRIGCAIYSAILGTVSINGDITNIKYSKKKSSIIASFKNTGNMHCRVKTNLIIFENGKNIYKRSIPSQLVLPGKTQNINIPIDTYLSKGTYRIKVTMDYGGKELLQGEKTIYITK